MNKKNWYMIIFSILAAGAGIWLMVEMAQFPLLSGFIKWALIAIVLLITLLVVIFSMTREDKKTSKIIACVIDVIFLVICVGANSLLGTVNTTFNNFTQSYKQLSTVMNVYVLADSSITDANGLNDQTIGYINNNPDAEASLKNSLAAENVTVQAQPAASIEDLVNALFDGSVPAIMINEGMVDSIQEMEGENFQNFSEKTRSVYTFKITKEAANENTAKVENITLEPFNVLITGMDSRNGFASASRSDVNMIATVNPQTGKILLTSIPRDYYVPFACEGVAGCPNGQQDKLTHTGLFGTEVTKQTLENLFGIDINYTLQVNFDSVTKIVDALGGIDIEVPAGYGVASANSGDHTGWSEGLNHFDGEHALMYARERYAYSEGDRQRGRNQMQVIQAIFNKATQNNSFSNYMNLLNALNGAFNTDLSQQEIRDLFQYEVSAAPAWNFEMISVDGSGTSAMSPLLGNYAYMMIPDQSTVDAAKVKMQETIR